MDVQENHYELVKQLSKSYTAETALVQQYVVDYFELGPKKADDILQKCNPKDKTKECINELKQVLFEKEYQKQTQNLGFLSDETRNKKVQVVDEFIRDFKKTGDFDKSYENAWKKISTDPDLKKDIEFQQNFIETAKSVKAEKKLGMAGLTIDPGDEEVLFKIRNTPRKNYDLDHSDTEVTEALVAAMKKLLDGETSIPALENKEALDYEHDATCVVKTKQISLSSQLAFKDVDDVSLDIKETYSEAAHYKKQQSALYRDGIDATFGTEERLKEKAHVKSMPTVYSQTEKMDVLRTLIHELKDEGKNPDMSYKNATFKAKQLNDTQLVELIAKYQVKDSKHHSKENAYSLLEEGYRQYIDFDPKEKVKDLQSEVSLLRNGKRCATVVEAIGEIQHKREALQVCTALRNCLQKSIAKATGRYKGPNKGPDGPDINPPAGGASAIAPELNKEKERLQAKYKNMPTGGENLNNLPWKNPNQNKRPGLSLN